MKPSLYTEAPMTRRKLAWAFSALALLASLPLAFFVAIILIGHARPLPYVSVWLDRLVLVGVSLGLPTVTSSVLGRLLTSGKR